MSIEDEPPHNVCHDCGITFENSFSLVDHMLEDDEDFDPYFLLPNGHKLMLGSLLRFFYANAENPEQVKLITQSTYITLFASEQGSSLVDELVEDMVVKSAFKDFDKDLQELLAEDITDEDEE